MRLVRPVTMISRLVLLQGMGVRTAAIRVLWFCRAAANFTRCDFADPYYFQGSAHLADLMRRDNQFDLLHREFLLVGRGPFVLQSDTR